MQTAPTVACVCTIGRESTRGQNVEAHLLRQKQIMHGSEREGGGGRLLYGLGLGESREKNTQR